jgi:hypothetical protein
MLGGTCLVRPSLNILFLADQTMPNFVTVRVTSKGFKQKQTSKI